MKAVIALGFQSSLDESNSKNKTPCCVCAQYSFPFQSSLNESKSKNDDLGLWVGGEHVFQSSLNESDSKNSFNTDLSPCLS